MTEAEKPFSIFVSSTFTDLKEYRELATTAIRSLRNHAKDMIDWPADERAPQSLSQDQLRESDLVILILAHRYGTIPEGTDRSITEMEFDAAVAASKPILSFFVHDEFKWFPSRFDTKHYEKLLAFKSKVAQHCTPQYFTTPESLAGLVFQSTLGFDTRHGRSQDLIAPGTLPVVYTSEILDTKADLLLHIGYAEDGLPLVLDVSRSDSLEELATLSDQADQHRRAWEREAKKQWVERGIHDLELPTKPTRCFVARKAIAGFFPRTILSYLLSSPIIAPTILLPREMSEQKRDSTRRQNRLFGISTAGAERYVVDQLSETRVVFVRDFVFESLKVFPHCEYEIVSQDRGALRGNLAMYARDLNQEFRRDVSGRSALRTLFRIRRLELAQIIKGLAERISTDYHQQHLVHGDLKPQNCLISAKEVVPIDPLELRVGEPSSAFTSIWSAPEQITNQPVSQATDVYPIGLMLVSLLSAKLGGEIAKYQLISATGETHILSIIRNPRVFISAEGLALDEKARRAWAETLGKCLRFDQAERYLDTQEVAVALENLLSDYAPSGLLSFELERGELQMLQVNGEDTLCRVLRDEPHGNLMKCATCNAVNRSTASFCSQCGCRFEL